MNNQRDRIKFSPPLPSAEGKLTGIVPFLIEAKTDRGDPEVFVTASEPSNHRLFNLPDEIVAAGSGASLTFEGARGATVGECVERYVFSVVHPEELVFGSYDELHKQEMN